MDSHNHLDEDDDFGGDFPGTHTANRSGNKRSYGDIEDDIFGSNKGNTMVGDTPMILSLRTSLEDCRNTLATCQSELEAAKSEIQKWHSAFQTESFMPPGSSPDLEILRRIIERTEKAKKKEAAFIVTFAKREQEIAELKSAVRDLKAQLKPPSMQARRLLLDPAIHEEFTRLKNLIDEKDKKVKELQDNIGAMNFTPQSKMGKMLMAKCRTLQEENEDIGNQAAEGKMHELAMKLALQKSVNAELRNQFEGLYKHMEGLTNDVEKSNEMVLILQERLEEKDGELNKLKLELQQNDVAEDAKTDSAPSKAVNDEMMKSKQEIEIS